MVISATTLKIISSVIAAILSFVLAYLTFIVSYRWQKRHGNINEIQTSVNNPFNLFILCGTIIITYYCVAKFLHDPTAFAVLLATSLLALVVFCLFLSYRFGKWHIIAASFFLLIFTPLICMGTTAAMTWLIPDVTIVYNDTGKRFASTTAYEWRPGAGMDLTGSYIDNLTDDTLYRVVVNYAIPGEDLYNVYSVAGIFPPKSFEKMKGKADYYMRPIPPFMRWSVGRTGRYRTQRIFVVDKKMLLKFIYHYDMTIFGLRPNRKVNSIKESKNRPIHEDPTRLTEYKIILNQKANI